MSTATECDRCGALFKSERGCLSLGQVYVANGKPTGEMDTWSDVDFCFGCSREILKVIGNRAMQGLAATLRGKSKNLKRSSGDN